MLNDNPNVTIELGAHTDRKGTDQYNERLAQRRAQSVVDYLIAGGIEAARLEAKGYGESVPKTINKKMAKQFDFLKEGDVLTEEFILALPPNSKRSPTRSTAERNSRSYVQTITYFEGAKSVISLKETANRSHSSAHRRTGVADKRPRTPLNTSHELPNRSSS